MKILKFSNYCFGLLSFIFLVTFLENGFTAQSLTSELSTNEQTLSDTQLKDEKEKVVFDVVSQIVRLNEIGVRIAVVSDYQDIDYEFLILPTPDLAAFALGDGSNRIFISTGLLETCDDDELAFILAHEIIHLEKRHPEKAIKRQESTEIVINLLGAVLGAAVASAVSASASPYSYSGQQLAQIASIVVGEIVGLGGVISFQKFNKELETEADKYGCIYMHKAGYNPKAAITLLNKLKKEEPKRTILVELLASHPNIDKRIENIDKWIKELTLKSP
ncbi:MAG: M48 family metallopeptidase [Candidatus Omnitrophica bacterium]|nr:M48 family metallopeptidase [Candidatus Omnitrophota bacterium]MCM8804397.1 M48 family metallopeptidase [Candidatus Omnitrophota bacterium]